MSTSMISSVLVRIFILKLVIQPLVTHVWLLKKFLISTYSFLGKMNSYPATRNVKCLSSCCYVLSGPVSSCCWLYCQEMHAFCLCVVNGCILALYYAMCIKVIYFSISREWASFSSKKQSSETNFYVFILTLFKTFHCAERQYLTSKGYTSFKIQKSSTKTCYIYDTIHVNETTFILY